MKQKIIRLFMIGMLTLVVGSVLWGGCKEQDVPFVIDTDELQRYIMETEDGKELFGIGSLAHSEPYTVPYDNGVYHDSFLSVKRGFDISIVPLTKAEDLVYMNYGNLGFLREAMVRVVDDFSIQTTRVYPDSTVIDTVSRRLTRYGFFLKLGGDGQAYIGWSLWGFNGIGLTAPLVSVKVERYDGRTFPGDYSAYRHYPLSGSDIPHVPYIRLSEIDTVLDGSRLVVTTNQASSAPTIAFHLISALGTDGAFTRAMIRMDTINVDTIRTLRGNPNLYNVVILQAFARDRYSYIMSWAIPYRL